jgi:hypothetical protein
MDRIATPQFRTELIRRLKNLFPDCEPEFLDEPGRGLRFRLKDRSGRYRSEVVHLHRYRRDLLTREALLTAVLGRRRYEAGPPKFKS